MTWCELAYSLNGAGVVGLVLEEPLRAVPCAVSEAPEERLSNLEAGVCAGVAVPLVLEPEGVLALQNTILVSTPS
jgi:hypothetical protein